MPRGEDQSTRRKTYSGDTFSITNSTLTDLGWTRDSAVKS
jgi:hypothetical protein